MAKPLTLKWQLTVNLGSTLDTSPALRAAQILCRVASLSQKRPPLSRIINSRSKSFRLTLYIANLMITKEKAVWETLWCKTSHLLYRMMATTRFLTTTRNSSSQMVTRMMTKFLMMMRTMKYSMTMTMMNSTAAMTKITVELSPDLVREELGRTNL